VSFPRRSGGSVRQEGVTQQLTAGGQVWDTTSMPITRIDCHLFRGEGASAEKSSYVAINPHKRPGSMVMAGAVAVRSSIGSQVACKLALQHFVASVLDYFDPPKAPDSCAKVPETPSMAANSAEFHAQEAPAPVVSLELLERAFKAANDSVYQFGHKLAAGGRLSTSLIGLVIEKNLIAAGRVGHGNAYLCREGEVFPFFETILDPHLGNVAQPGQLTDGYVGSQSMVSVELASVPLRPHDVIFLCAEPLDAFGERELYGVLDDLGVTYSDRPREPSTFVCDQLVQSLYPAASEIPFAMLAVVGPETIYLKASSSASDSAVKDSDRRMPDNYSAGDRSQY
jgi:hypothetical protein